MLFLLTIEVAIVRYPRFRDFAFDEEVYRWGIRATWCSTSLPKIFRGLTRSGRIICHIYLKFPSVYSRVALDTIGLAQKFHPLRTGCFISFLTQNFSYETLHSCKLSRRISGRWWLTFSPRGLISWKYLKFAQEERKTHGWECLALGSRLPNFEPMMDWPIHYLHVVSLSLWLDMTGACFSCCLWHALGVQWSQWPNNWNWLNLSLTASLSTLKQIWSMDYFMSLAGARSQPYVIKVQQIFWYAWPAQIWKLL